jgi:hypothetical protein
MEYDFMIDSEDNLDEFFQKYSPEIDLNKCFYYPEIERMYESYKPEIIDINDCFHYSDYDRIIEKYRKNADENGSWAFDDEWSGTLGD